MRQLVKAPDRKLLGVAGGIADYFAMDRTVVRAITVLACIVIPPLVLGYFVLGMVLPDGGPAPTRPPEGGIAPTRPPEGGAAPTRPPEGGPGFTPPGEPGATTPGSAPPGARAGHRKMAKSRERWLTGVAGGIAQYCNIDPLIIRGLFLVAFLAFGTGALVYVVLSVVMPGPDAA